MKVDWAARAAAVTGPTPWLWRRQARCAECGLLCLAQALVKGSCVQCAKPARVAPARRSAPPGPEPAEMSLF